MDDITKRGGTVERRKHKRFRVQAGTCAVLVSHFYKWGQIIDVSRGGLAFHYSGNTLPPNASSHLGISMADIGFYLRRIPFKVISDFEMAKEDYYSLKKTRRCGVEFGELTLNQMSQLEYFILNHSFAEVH